MPKKDDRCDDCGLLLENKPHGITDCLRNLRERIAQLEKEVDELIETVYA